MPKVTILPDGLTQSVSRGTNLLALLCELGLSPDAPCGGNGSCGKCLVTVNGSKALACRTVVDRDMTVEVPRPQALTVLRDGMNTLPSGSSRPGCHLAFDIGTTSLVCYLLDGQTGTALAHAGMKNPQSSYGADVISRIRAALDGHMDALTVSVRSAMTELAQTVCRSAALSPEQIRIVSVVGNPAMQQLFLGISPENLVQIPFTPVITEAKSIPCAPILPICQNARLLVVPDISGYVGADTLGCILATRMYQAEDITLLVDIGTNGELVLGNRHRLIACATAAGPAMEGAGIRFGMQAAPGAIDHVWIEDGTLRFSTIGGASPIGICGSGLIDAVATALELGLLNKRGRILTSDELDGQRIIPLTDGICLTQEDIRQLQLAKGAIHAGITLMAAHLGISLRDIRQVLLAGAFGSFLNPLSACRIGLLPEELRGRIRPIGNAAGTGAKMLALDPVLLQKSQQLSEQIEFLELAALADFSRTFAKSMTFREVQP